MLLDRGQTQFAQPDRGGAERRLVGEVTKGSSRPQPERFAQQARRYLWVLAQRTPPIGRQRGKPLRVDGIGRALQPVPAVGRRNDFMPDRLAQPRHVHLERLAGRDRWILTPDVVDQAVGRDRLIGMHQERCEHHTLPSTSRRQRPTTLERLQRSKNRHQRPGRVHLEPCGPKSRAGRVAVSRAHVVASLR